MPPKLADPEIVFSYVVRGKTLELAAEIAAGFDVNHQDSRGMTLLHYAARDGYRAAVRLLLKTNRCNHLLSDNQGRYPSELAIEWARDYALGRLLTLHQVRQADREGVPAYVRPADRTKATSSAPVNT